jgi:16S rRNA (adenine1518-N6/adenine1519-N6)-dimethyltransferase
MQSTRPKKSLGQHFLKDEAAAGSMVEALEPRPGERVLEIGAGRGDLTEKLLDAGFEVRALEIDRELIRHLEKRFSGRENLRIHTGDALKVDLGLFGTRYKVAANLPYQTATAITARLLEDLDRITLMVMTYQKEVARRITALPGSRDYGYLTCLIQFHCTAQYLLTIPPGAFRPVPKVESGVVRLEPRSGPPPLEPDQADRLFGLIKKLFTHRRKTLLNAMEAGGLAREGKEGLKARLVEAGLDPGLRPERFSLEEFILMEGIIHGGRERDLG